MALPEATRNHKGLPFAKSRMPRPDSEIRESGLSLVAFAFFIIFDYNLRKHLFVNRNQERCRGDKQY
jgi:hypothetical protein